MIGVISSSLPTFKTMRFSPGLNIVLADVAESSTDRHTRNSAGKTSLVEVIHFLLGSDANKGSVFKHSALERHTFSMEMHINDRLIKVTRSGLEDDRVYLSNPDAAAIGLSLSPDQSVFAEDGYVALETWKTFLGVALFGLPKVKTGTEFDGRGAPTFRQLIGYFIRRQKDGGFDSIEKFARDQQPGSWQVAISYLIGLDWAVAREFQFMRDRRRSLAALKKAIDEGEFPQIFGTTAEIRPELARTEERIRRLKAQIETFQVHDSYRELASEASALKDRITELTFELAEAESAVEYMRRSLDQEAPPKYSDVEHLYRAAGVELPDIALRRFEDVKAFQHSVSTNRKRYLQDQIDDMALRHVYLIDQLRRYSFNRTDILRSLDGKGAFEDLIRLRENLGELTSRSETLNSKLQHAAVIENNQAQLKAASAELQLKLQQSLENNEESIKKATVLVDQAITKLYDDRTGNLIVEASRSGPKVRIEIQGGGNKGGIDMMKIFCFDTALLRLAHDRFSPGPRLLVHDSHLFDGVDSRQVSQALTYGKHAAEEVGGQYIVTINSDEFENAEKASDHSLLDYVNTTRLTDDENGGLFGFRFDLG